MGWAMKYGHRGGRRGAGGLLAVGVIAVLGLSFSPEQASGEDCRKSPPCADNELLNAKACCEPRPVKLEDCKGGRVRSDKTLMHCCWPGQAWSGKSCEGKPDKCPGGYDLGSNDCLARECERGQERVKGKVYCCWPGQKWDDKRELCVGAPKCPGAFERDGDAERCVGIDRDNDGILNRADLCPSDAEDMDGFKDDDGCPDPDNDFDGVPDLKDQCPHKAEDKNGYKDDDGCPDQDELDEEQRRKQATIDAEKKRQSDLEEAQRRQLAEQENQRLERLRQVAQRQAQERELQARQGRYGTLSTASFIGAGASLVGWQYFLLKGLGQKKDLEAVCPDFTCPTGQTGAIDDLRSTARLGTIFAVATGGFAALGVTFKVLQGQQKIDPSVGLTLVPGSLNLTGKF